MPATPEPPTPPPPSLPRPAESDFARLSRRVQIERLRQLARIALAAYDLGTVRLTLVAHRYNTIFRVETAAGQRYALRIHRVDMPTVASVGAELAWLAALRRDTPLEVPAPVPTRTGALLTVATAPGVPASQICVLLRWMEGRRVDAGLTPRHLERVGTLMAHLQNHASQFNPPPGFARGRVEGLIESARWLPDPLAPAVVAAYHTLVADTLSAAEAALVMAVLERIRAAEQALAQEPGTFGLMHGDLHQYNLLFQGDTVKAIDFDDCGFGPLLYDFAVPLTMLHDRANYPALRAGLLAGYRRARPLSAAHEALLDTFIALRHLQDALWMLDASTRTVFPDDWAAQARANLAPLAGFLAAGGRFPTDPL